MHPGAAASGIPTRAGGSALPAPLQAWAGSVCAFPALLCQVLGGHAASPGEGTTARAAWRGLSRGAHRTWTGLSRDVGTLVDTHGAPFPAAPAGASTAGGNEQVRTAPRKTAREEPQRLPRPEQSPQSRFSLSGTFGATPGGRPWPCSASGHRERDPPPRPCSGTGRKAGSGDTSGDDKENLGGDGENPSSDG